MTHYSPVIGPASVASHSPKTAANRQLVVNDDLQAPIYYIGPTQVNIQVPSNAPLGTARLAVRTADTGEEADRDE